MSQFLSPKFLRYSETRAHGRIDADRDCPGCGYNLRGLEAGRNCPECGQSTLVAQVSDDPLLVGDDRARLRWELGLGLAALCVFFAAGLRLAFFALGLTGVPTSLALGYITLIGVNAALWTVAVWLSTPECIDGEMSWLRRPRLAARWLSLFWVPGFVCIAVRYQAGSTNEWLIFGDLLGRTLGGVGVLCFAFVMLPLATRAELVTVANRLNTVVWLLWFPTLVAQAFAVTIVWYMLIPLGLVLLTWTWLLSLLGLALLAMNRHMKWARTGAANSPARLQRIAETRHALDAPLASKIRPLPPRTTGDVPLDER